MKIKRIKRDNPNSTFLDKSFDKCILKVNNRGSIVYSSRRIIKKLKKGVESYFRYDNVSEDEILALTYKYFEIFLQEIGTSFKYRYRRPVLK